MREHDWLNTGYYYCGRCNSFKSKRPHAVSRHMKERHGIDAGRDADDLKSMIPKPRRYR